MRPPRYDERVRTQPYPADALSRPITAEVDRLSRVPKILLAAPEASSDPAAAMLAEALQSRHDVQLFGLGRSALRDSGVEMLCDTSRLGQVGLGAVLLSMPAWYQVWRRMSCAVKSIRPDVIVPFACRHFTLYVLGAVDRLDHRVAWVYPPGDWVQNNDRDDAVLAAADLFICAYKWQARRLAGHGGRVLRVPHHSTLDLGPEIAPAELRRDLGLDPRAGPIVGVLPGSRSYEVARLMPILCKAVRRLHEHHRGLQVVVSHAPGISEAQLAPHISRLQCPAIITNMPVRRLAPALDLALVCCGTASTEVAFADCPEVILYKPHWLTARLTERRGKKKGIRFLSMLNIGMDQRVAPELLDRDCTPEGVAAAARKILTDPAEAARMRELYAQFRLATGDGSWDAAADEIVALASQPTDTTRARP